MQETYNIGVSKDKKAYRFFSEGPNGSIEKRVYFQSLPVPNRYNLALCDIIYGKENYENITGNKDLDMVFGTIAAIVQHFINSFPNAEVYLTGNTKAKTRLYQIKVANNLEEIQTDFEVYGCKVDAGPFTSFRKGENYTGILVKRK